MPASLITILLFVGCHRDKDVDPSNPDEEEEEDTTPPEPEPIEPTGWTDDVAIAFDSGDSQGEPSAIALPSGRIFASWMEQQRSGEILVNLTHSDDNGATWSEPFFVDPDDRVGWQNDPAFAYADGRLVYTWLAVGNSSGTKSTIYCIESTDDGETWSEQVALSPSGEFVDRQWMASRDDKMIITWDYFPSNYSTEQVYSASTSGCSGFSEPITVAEGIFLNGVPAIDADGDVWLARNEFGRMKISYIVSKLDGDAIVDNTVQTYEYPDGAYYMTNARHEDESEERPGEEEEEYAVYPGIYSTPELAAARLGIYQDLEHNPRATARGTFTGEYSPVLAALPDGALGVIGMATDDVDTAYADIYFTRIEADGTIGEPMIVQQDDAAGNPQFEPWLTVDAAGGLHAIWYDGREGEWRLYSAHSSDGGASWNELVVGDNSFTRGFDQTSYADYYAWVGHFQGLVATDDAVVAIYASSHESNISHVYAATTTTD